MSNNFESLFKPGKFGRNTALLLLTGSLLVSCAQNAAQGLRQKIVDYSNGYNNQYSQCTAPGKVVWDGKINFVSGEHNGYAASSKIGIQGDCFTLTEVTLPDPESPPTSDPKEAEQREKTEIIMIKKEIYCHATTLEWLADGQDPNDITSVMLNGRNVSISSIAGEITTIIDGLAVQCLTAQESGYMQGPNYISPFETWNGENASCSNLLVVDELSQSGSLSRNDGGIPNTLAVAGCK